MAYKIEKAGSPPGYLIHDRVGRNLANRRDDVLLVQFLLKHALTNAIPNPRDWKPLGDLVMDGVYGPTTDYWCLHFHHVRARKGGIDPYKPNAEQGLMDDFYPYTVQHFTIPSPALESITPVGQLNVLVYQKNRTLFADITKMPGCPRELATALKTNRPPQSYITVRPSNHNLGS